MADGTLSIGGIAYEYEAEAAAGRSLDDGSFWHGARIRYRAETERRWSSIVAIDVHPMDGAAVLAALSGYIDKRGARAVPA